MSDPGSKIYAAFIDAELKAENDQRASVNNRAAAALTGATGLVTLALAVFAVLLGKDHVFTGLARLFLVVALTALLLSGGCAVAAGFPWRLKQTSLRTIDKMLNSRRNDTEDIARDAVAFCNAVTIESLRAGTAVKVKFLLAAGICQVLAIAGLGAATWAVVTDSSARISIVQLLLGGAVGSALTYAVTRWHQRRSRRAASASSRRTNR